MLLVSFVTALDPKNGVPSVMQFALRRVNEIPAHIGLGSVGNFYCQILRWIKHAFHLPSTDVGKKDQLIKIRLHMFVLFSKPFS